MKIKKMPAFPAIPPIDGVLKGPHIIGSANIDMKNKQEPRDEGMDFSGQLKTICVHVGGGAEDGEKKEDSRHIVSDRTGAALKAVLPPTCYSQNQHGKGYGEKETKLKSVTPAPIDKSQKPLKG